jgi:hypothetical protein
MMARLSTRRMIGEIERIVEEGVPVGQDLRQWYVHGVDCTRERHRHSGPFYDFTIEVLMVDSQRCTRAGWRLMLVTEWWHAPGDGRDEWRATKWLKLVAGRQSDVAAWLRHYRDSWDVPGAEANASQEASE